EEIIAVNQDPLGKQGGRIHRDLKKTGHLEVYAGEVVDGTVFILFNRSLKKEVISAVFSEGGHPEEGGNVRDLVNHKDLGYFDFAYETEVEPHSAVVIKVTNK